ncbi:hypothetical protein BSM4216_2497 [Bacillus smithii]|nr:hypothetical protein BSM4216_2497 [Bacillus smithii]
MGKYESHDPLIPLIHFSFGTKKNILSEAYHLTKKECSYIKMKEVFNAE